MYYTSFTGCRWHASSTTAPLCSCDTLVARDLTLTDSSNMCLSMHHFLHAGSLLCILTVSSAIMFLREESFTSSSQPAVTVVTLHLIKAVKTLGKLKTEQCPTSFSHGKNTMCGLSDLVSPEHCFHTSSRGCCVLPNHKHQALKHHFLTAPAPYIATYNPLGFVVCMP